KTWRVERVRSTWHRLRTEDASERCRGGGGRRAVSWPPTDGQPSPARRELPMRTAAAANSRAELGRNSTRLLCPTLKFSGCRRQSAGTTGWAQRRGAGRRHLLPKPRSWPSDGFEKPGV